MKRKYKDLFCTSVNEDGVYWCLYEHWIDPYVVDWKYCIVQYAFVPGYNVAEVSFGEATFSEERVVSNHKTLKEAAAILRILLSDPDNMERDGSDAWEEA